MTHGTLLKDSATITSLKKDLKKLIQIFIIIDLIVCSQWTDSSGIDRMCETIANVCDSAVTAPPLPEGDTRNGQQHEDPSTLSMLNQQKQSEEGCPDVSITCEKSLVSSTTSVCVPSAYIKITQPSASSRPQHPKHVKILVKDINLLMNMQYFYRMNLSVTSIIKI